MAIFISASVRAQHENLSNKPSDDTTLCSRRSFWTLCLVLCFSLALASFKSSLKLAVTIGESIDCFSSSFALSNVTANGNEMSIPSIPKHKSSKEIDLLLPPDQIEWMKNRSNHFDSWYKVGFDKGVPEQLHKPVDKDGPVLVFLIVGFPKCGTTTLMANLANIAPMPTKSDVCTPPSRTVLYAYKNWPKEYGYTRQRTNATSIITSEFDKIFRGSKCPKFISTSWIYDIKEYLPRTKLIVGIRHPIKWFESFWRMFDTTGPYDKIGICPCNVDEHARRRGNCKACRNECLRRLFCLARARFHLPLARLGKTSLGTDERRLLAPNDADGGDNLITTNVTNPVFLYEQTQLKEDYFWEELADFLGVSHN